MKKKLPTQVLSFYEFNQNNSGGSFVIDDKRGIGPCVWVEASCSEDANMRARNIGIYFDGVSDGSDCPCCGDRWSSVWTDEGEKSPKINPKYAFNWHNAVYVHHADGAIERIKPPKASEKKKRKMA